MSRMSDFLIAREEEIVWARRQNPFDLHFDADLYAEMEEINNCWSEYSEEE